MEQSVADERPAKRLKTSELLATDEAAQNGTSPIEHGANSSPEEKTINTREAVERKEQLVGITAFINPQQQALAGIYKKRYTDFLVNEILPNGQVLHLKSTTVTKKIADSAKQQTGQGPNTQEARQNGDSAQISDAQGEEKSNVKQEQSSEISEEDRAKLVEYLGETAVAEILALFAAITTHPKKRARDHPFVKTSFTSDRTVRTEIHQAIRRIFHSRIDSSTNNEGILVLSAANPNFRNNHQSRVGKLSWIERGGEHCHFTLYKEMKDTMESISFLAYLMKKNARDFQIAGTKDRRAATVQRVSVWRVEAERVAALNRNQTMRNATLGDFEYRTSGLQLGDLSGNEFVVTLRDCRFIDGSNDTEAIRSSLQASLANARTDGFLNYYGLQRFGTFAVRSDVIGLQLLKGDFEGACNSILDYPTSALNEDDSTVGRDDRDRARAIKIFKETNSIRDSLAVMPKRLSAETAVIRALGRKGNDFLGALMTLQRNMRQMYVHAYQSLVWNTAATNRWRLWGNRVIEGDLVLVKEHNDKDADGAAADEGVDADGEVVIHAEGEDRAKGEESFDRARALTQTEAESGKYSIFDLVLPLPGFDVIYPQNESGGDYYKEIMGKDGLDPFDMRRGQKDFSLSGSYRKIVARIGADFDVQAHRYTQDDEQFVLTDREALMGKRTDEKRPEVEDGVPAAEEQKTAAVLKFQLGTSQYATMVLRELSSGGLEEYKPGFSGGR
ncbi:uncharacterized protein HMPREF1541_00341 [Cyphellophora europaea CBS 101466]|uniref:TRUD domain-containing protein n=1 Tax=Cyphellophora europaea (strain CBS 101466) TaxID=1220924 RepID=W2SBS4_CYPE1|nr:uncharacterized protein HMPREF1541_00341 [Cyphellophora europaea CBS 101466]ETN46157.1 hypothetical protein HMPREF1541_00341 [Cyphellophora europaea CBS 101466]